MKCLILGPCHIIYMNKKFIEYKTYMMDIDVLILIKEEFMNYKYFFKYNIKHVYVLKNISTFLCYNYIIDFNKFYVLFESHKSFILPKLPENNTLHMITEKNFFEFFNTYRMYQYTYTNIYTQFICFLRRWENICLFFSAFTLMYLWLVIYK